MPWEIKIAKGVYKEIKRLPKRDMRRILGVLESLPENPYFGDIEKLSGEVNVWRRRAGVYRITYELFTQNKFIAVLDVQRRTTTTYRKRK